ncbi:hypothetical protein [Bradyrhizobium sp.]|uniref:hypothetical protein n=1 Tax=Bradyrhizobium sp. TaxID=376 RepID=UPI00260BAF4B|nr:hypothetical protein [Bradyrhizobium sp.]
MPVLRYFMFVGGALLALLLIVGAWMPSVPPAASSGSATDLSVIRIHSDHKWPDRVVFDTTHPTIVPAPTVVAQAPPPKSENDQQSKGQAREAFAQLRPNPSPDEHRGREPKRKRRSVVKNYAGPPKGYLTPPRFMVAQQRPVFLFGNNIW